MGRNLSPKLKAFFDARLTGPVSPGFLVGNPREMLVEAATCCIGVTEEGRDNFGEIVELFQGTIGTANGEPWCLAFVQSCVAYIESFGFTSELFPTEHCLTAWVNSKCPHPIVAQPGDIVVYHKEDTTQGHVGIITEASGAAFWSVEGNTSAANGIIERNGDGVYRKFRVQKTMLGKMRVLGFLRPF